MINFESHGLVQEMRKQRESIGNCLPGVRRFVAAFEYRKTTTSFACLWFRSFKFLPTQKAAVETSIFLEKKIINQPGTPSC